MDFNQVRYFLALADTLNFTRAADRCKVSQPALTQAIRRLEDELDGPLIVRDGSRTSLTYLGETLHANFKQIDNARQLLRSTARSMAAGTHAALDIGVMCTIEPSRITPLLQKFKQANPQVTLVLHTVLPEEISEMVATGALDGVFCSRLGPANGKLHYRELFHEDMVVAFAKGHHFENRRAISFDQIANEPYVDRLHCEFRQRFHEFADDNELSLNLAASSEREDWVQSIVANGMGIAILPESLATASRLSNRPFEPKISRTVEFALAKSASMPKALKNLFDLVQAHEWSAKETSWMD